MLKEETRKRMMELAGLTEHQEKKQPLNEALQKRKKLIMEQVSKDDFDIFRFDRKPIQKNPEDEKLYEV